MLGCRFFFRRMIKSKIEQSPIRRVFDLSSVSNLRFSSHNSEYKQLYQALQKWNNDSQSSSSADLVHEFIYQQLRIIKLEDQPVRSNNLERLYRWFNARAQPRKSIKLQALVKTTQNKQNEEEQVKKNFKSVTFHKLKEYNRRLFDCGQPVKLPVKKPVQIEKRHREELSWSSSSKRLFSYHTRELCQERERQEFQCIQSNQQQARHMLRTKSLNNSLHLAVLTEDVVKRKQNCERWRKEILDGWKHNEQQVRHPSVAISGLTLMSYPNLTLKNHYRKRESLCIS